MSAKGRQQIGVVLAIVGAIGIGSHMVSGQAGVSWVPGDVFVAVGGGKYNVYSNAGVLKDTIDDGLGGFTTGCAFDTHDNLYTTNFSHAVVKKWDGSTHAVVGTFPSQPASGDVLGDLSPESIVFASNGDFYVGHADGARDIEKHNAAGAFAARFNAATEDRGTDWIDLAGDQTTMYYTSEGRTIKRFNVSTNTQLADLVTLPGDEQAGEVLYAIRLLPPSIGSGLLVANKANILRLDASGAVVQTYDVLGDPDLEIPGEWFGLTLDPNGTSFWAGTRNNGHVYRFNIATGAIEVMIATGVPLGSPAGSVCVKGEPTQGDTETQTGTYTPTNPSVKYTYDGGSNAMKVTFDSVNPVNDPDGFTMDVVAEYVDALPAWASTLYPNGHPIRYAKDQTKAVIYHAEPSQTFTPPRYPEAMNDFAMKYFTYTSWQAPTSGFCSVRILHRRSSGEVADITTGYYPNGNPSLPDPGVSGEDIVWSDFIALDNTITGDVFGAVSGKVADMSKYWKSGSTIPVQFTFTGTTAPTARLAVAKLRDDVTALFPADIDAAGSSNDQFFRCDTLSHTCTYNLQTKNLSSGTWQGTIVVDSTSAVPFCDRSFKFSLK